MLRLIVAAHVMLMKARLRLRRARMPDEAGQATAEYALVLLGVAAIALLLGRSAIVVLVGGLVVGVVAWALGAPV